MLSSANCVFKMLPVKSLVLDVDNPRVARVLEMYGSKVTPADMALALGSGDSQVGQENTTTFRSLRESIKTNKGIIHPIIVDKRADGSLVVIEGNTRTLIYQDYLAQDVPGDWSSIPAIVYSELSDGEKDAIRLQAHLVGPRPWDPYSKAKYLTYLRNSEYLPLSEVVDYCGGRKKEVLDYIDAYLDMEKYYRSVLETDQDFDTTRFSAFVELQKPGIKEAIREAGFDEFEFARWVDSGIVYPLNTVRALPRILRNLKAREVFIKEGAKEAQKILDVPSPDKIMQEASLQQLAREITRRVEQLPFSDMQRLQSSAYVDEYEALQDARDQLIQLCTMIASEE